MECQRGKALVCFKPDKAPAVRHVPSDGVRSHRSHGHAASDSKSRTSTERYAQQPLSVTQLTIKHSSAHTCSYEASKPGKALTSLVPLTPTPSLVCMYGTPTNTGDTFAHTCAARHLHGCAQRQGLRAYVLRRRFLPPWLGIGGC